MPGRQTRKKALPRQQPRSKPRQSAPWVPMLVFGLLGGGAIMIILNKLGTLPGGSQPYQFGIGLGLIAAGLVAATQWR